jgi:hypothetical protein
VFNGGAMHISIEIDPDDIRLAQLLVDLSRVMRDHKLVPRRLELRPLRKTTIDTTGESVPDSGRAA